MIQTESNTAAADTSAGYYKANWARAVGVCVCERKTTVQQISIKSTVRMLEPFKRFGQDLLYK